MKNIIKIFAVIVLLLFSFYSGYAFKSRSSVPSGIDNSAPAGTLENEEKIKVSLMLDFGDGTIKTFNGVELASGSTVFDLLKAVTANNSLALDFKDYGGDLGVMINSIGGYGSDLKAGKYWQYWLNNEYAKVGASAQKLEAGDIIEWKLIKSQF